MRTNLSPALSPGSTSILAVFALAASASAQLIWDPDGDQVSNGGAGTWDTTSLFWDDDGTAPNVAWDNTGASEAEFGSGTYTVAIEDLTVGDLTYTSAGSGTLTFESVTDNNRFTIKSGGATWDTGGAIIAFNNFNDGTPLDVGLTIGAGDTLSVAGGGRFDTGESPNGANWVGDVIEFTSATVVKGSANTIGQIGLTKLPGGSKYVHGRNANQDYNKDWELTGSGNVTFDNTWNGRTMWLNGVFSGTGGLTFSGLNSANGGGSGFARLNDVNNSFEGGIVVDGSVNTTLLQIVGGDAILGAVPGAFDADNITLKDGGRLRFNGTTSVNANRGVTLVGDGVFLMNGGATTLGGPITGTGSLTIGVAQDGSGNTLVLNAASDYFGGTNIVKGTLQLGVDDAIPTDSSLMIGGSGGASSTLKLNGFDQTVAGLDSTGGNARQIVNGSSTAATLTISGGGVYDQQIGNPGLAAGDDANNFAVVKTGTGTLNVIGADNGYNGGLSVTGGAYQISADNGLGSAPAAPTTDSITLDGGNLHVRMAGGTGGSFEIDANRLITLGAGGGTIQVTTPSGAWAVTYNGVISGSGSLTKSAGQTLILGGTNTYTGETIVSAGTLRLPGSLASEVTVGNAVFVPGDSASGSGSGSMDALTLEANAKLNCYINTSTTDAGKAIVSGAVNIDAAAILNVIDKGGGVLLATGTKLTLVDYTGGSRTGTFAGLPDGASILVGPNFFILDYDDGGNLVTLTAADPYDTWATGFSLVGGFDDDDDGDGIDNGLEFVLDGDPTVPDRSILPIPTLDATDLTYSYTRRTDSKSSTTQIVQWSTDLEIWNDIVVDPGDPDSVDVVIPRSNESADGKLFVRLYTSKP